MCHSLWPNREWKVDHRELAGSRSGSRSVSSLQGIMHAWNDLRHAHFEDCSGAWNYKDKHHARL